MDVRKLLELAHACDGQLLSINLSKRGYEQLQASVSGLYVPQGPHPVTEVNPWLRGRIVGVRVFEEMPDP